MGSFYSPYYFVPVVRGQRRGDLHLEPLRKNAKPTDLALDGMRHDRYEAGRLGGVISCTAMAKSPMFVGDKKDKTSSNVTGFTLDNNPALPASSLRGLISSIAEAASNSALRVLSRKVLEQECYSYRKPMNEAITAVGKLIRTGETWELEPICLPNLRYDRQGRLLPEMNKWRTVFSSRPVFRVYAGTFDLIRQPMGVLTGQNGKLRLEPLNWNQVVDIGVHGNSAPACLNVKNEMRGNLFDDNGMPIAPTIVEQRMSHAPGDDPRLKASALVRVLGCYEKDGDEQPIRNIPDTKKHELFLPYKAGRFKRITVPDFVINRFEQLADQMTEDSKTEASPRPYEPKDTRPGRSKGERLVPQEGDLVFFDVNLSGTQVAEIAYSSIWRGRIEVSPDHPDAANAWSFFEKVDTDLVPLHGGRSRLTLAERVFGFIEEKTNTEEGGGLSWKGRVGFSHGISTQQIEEMPEIPLKELSGPKPPSPTMYFRKSTGKNQYIQKSALRPGTHWPQGRKFFLHHPDAINGNSQPWRADERDFNPDRHVRVRPWPKGSTWTFGVRFDNLSDLELGMILYALKPNDGFVHKLGMGKPIGLGSVEITIDRVQTIDRQKRYTADGWGKPRFSGEELDWARFRKGFRDGMCAEIRTTLEALGDPTQLRQDVQISYPVCTGLAGSGKQFEWFVANEERARRPPRDGVGAQVLQPVSLLDENKNLHVRIEALEKIPPPRNRDGQNQRRPRR